jgi:oligopeptide/dipeptide ABC transporter ATP-binding protein
MRRDASAPPTWRPDVLELRRLVKSFPGQAAPAVDDVSLRVNAGETLGLVGESGSGKTTLGRCTLLLEKPTSGGVVFDGRDLAALSGEELRRMRRHMQIVFQDPVGSLNPRMRVERILAEPFDIHENLSRSATRDRVRELLDAVGLPQDSASRYPHEFSGGQRQRIGIARAIALRPKFIVADEPVSALDVSVGAQIVNLLCDLQEKFGLTYLFISHGLPLVRRISSRIAVMYLGRIAEIGPTDDLFERPAHPYTVLLRESTPRIDPAPREPARFPEAPAQALSGCRFRNRCPLAAEKCAQEVPPLREIGPGHLAACHFAERVAQ